MVHYRLVPESPGRFRMRTKPWVLKFVLDDDGQATAAVYPFITDRRRLCTRILNVPVRPPAMPAGVG